MPTWAEKVPPRWLNDIGRGDVIRNPDEDRTRACGLQNRGLPHLLSGAVTRFLVRVLVKFRSAVLAVSDRQGLDRHHEK